MGTLLHHAVDEAAGRDPDRDAFRCHGQGLRYGDLVSRANRLARVLIDQGVKPHDRVGIYMTKGLDLPVALYAVLKAGAAYVPFDPAAPMKRLTFLVENCGLRHLITSQPKSRRAVELARRAPTLESVIGADPNAAGDGGHHDARVIPLVTAESAPPEDPGVAVSDRDLAYIMYTSGSTGLPKGLAHTHHSGRSYALVSAREYGVRPEDRLGNHSPLHFDMSTFEYLTGPLCGSTTVIMPEETTIFPRSVATLIEDERLTFWYSVPLALTQLLETGALEGRDLGSLRWVLFGGEPFPPKHLARLMELLPAARFSNSYGPAEVNQCTAYHLPPGAVDRERSIPIGHPLPGVDIRIVDEQDREVAAGTAGELLVHAPTMMRGYWARPDLDAQAFYPADDGRLFYRTGDLVERRATGDLDFLGRKDRQVKVRGYRVELGEIEAVLGALPDVVEAAAVDLRDPEGRATIAAAVLLCEGAAIDARELRERAADRLPAYAVPTRMALRRSLPRTATGKVDHRALRRDLSSPS